MLDFIEFAIEKGESIGIKKGESIGIKKGEVLGIKKGRVLTLKETIQDQLSARFGEVPEQILDDIQRLTSYQTLKHICSQVWICKDLESFEALVGQGLTDESNRDTSE